MVEARHVRLRAWENRATEPEPELLETLLSAVPVERRLPVALTHELGLSPQESAEVLQLAPEEFERRERRGLRELCRLLADWGWERLPSEVGEALGRLPRQALPARLVQRLRRLVEEGIEPAAADGGTPEGEG